MGAETKFLAPFLNAGLAHVTPCALQISFRYWGLTKVEEAELIAICVFDVAAVKLAFNT